MSASASRAPWPPQVWDALVLRGLDARSRSELEAAGALRVLDDHEFVFAAGSPADSLVVVVAGEVVVSAVPRGERVLREQRVARAGEVVGEEAMVIAHGERAGEARARGRVTVAELPVAVLARALGRSEAGGAASLVRRALARGAAREALAGSSLALSGEALDRALDVARHVTLERGGTLFREGDAAGEIFVVASGLVQLRRAEADPRAKARVLGYARRGDVVGDEDERGPRTLTASAPGPVWALGLPRALVARTPRAVRRLRVVDDVGRASAGLTTAHVFADVYRLSIARSLLVIDQDACVRCGRCVWSCASTHDDGVARLARRGEVLVVGEGAARAPLLVPNSCQHCRHPACLADCPTGAITRDTKGDVTIRAELCTGCGACAKACPWENIQLAPSRAAAGPALVAVKCDLCGTREGGPACVSACPTEAIARIDPEEALGDALARPRELPSPLPSRVAGWPFATGAILAAIGLALARPRPAVSGVTLLGVLAALACAVATARAPRARLLAPLRRLLSARGGRASYLAHLTLGTLAAGLGVAHVGVAPRASAGLAGALVVAFALALATGAWLAVAFAVLPPRLARLEREGRLPEDLALRLGTIDERIFAALTGRSDELKALWARALAPYVASRIGPAVLLARGRSLRDEERAVRAGLASSSRDRAGLDALVRLAVEHRATRASRVLHVALRLGLAPHVAFASVALVLLVAHLVAVRGALVGGLR